MLQTILLVVHVLVALALIAIILLQQGRGATAGAAFGSGASGTVFGARGSATFLSRATSVLAILFFGNCLLLAWLASGQSAPRSLGDEIAAQAAASTEITERVVGDPAQKDTPQALAPASGPLVAPDQAAAPEPVAPVPASPADVPQIPASQDKP
jgi:preprotein translocase subunit SecG